MEPRRLSVMVELETDLTVAELEKAANYRVHIVDRRGVTHLCPVIQVDPNAIRQKPRAKAKRYRKAR